MDIMVPSVVSNRNIYFLLIGDQFTKWFEIIPMSNQEASRVANVFVNAWITRFGCSVNLHIDRSSNFMSKVFKNICEDMRFNWTSTPDYQPQGNAISQLKRVRQNMWANITKSGLISFLLVMMAYWSSVHYVTIYSFLALFWIMSSADWLPESDITNKILPDIECLCWLNVRRTTNVPWNW